MSVNTAHANNGVLIHAGEYILLHSDNVTIDFSGQDNPIFNDSKQGRIYLTSHRMIFNNKKGSDPMQSFSAPFVAMSNLELEQPVFGANYIRGKVRAQLNGNFVGEVKFKIYFKSGGAIEYGQALRRAALTAQENMRNAGAFSDDPPPYTPSGAWHEAPPPAYQPPPGYYGWLPAHDAFSGPAPNTVFMSDNPPPYAGIGGPPPYSPSQPATDNLPSSGFREQPGQPQQPWQPQQPQQPWQPQQPQQPWQPQQPQQPTQAGWGAPGYQQPPPYGYGMPGHTAAQNTGYGYQPQQYNPNGPSWNGFSMPPTNEQRSPQQPPPGGAAGAASAPSWNGFSLPPGGATGGAVGFNAPPANSKEAEAMGSAFNTPYNQPGGNNTGSSGMPPSYDDLPPNYADYSRKNQ